MNYLFAFLIGGFICAIGELIIDVLNLTPAHATTLLVCLGGILYPTKIYDKLIKLGNAGALLPITSFGNSMTKSAVLGLKEEGFIGIFNNLFKSTSAGISFAIIISFMFAIIIRPKN